MSDIIYRINGRVVTQEEFMKGAKGLLDGAPYVSPSSCWPMTSWAAGVHPAQVDEVRRQSVDLGVPTDFTPDGDAIFTSRRHRKKYCEAVGLFDRNAGDGDPVPQKHHHKGEGDE